MDGVNETIKFMNDDRLTVFYAFNHRPVHPLQTNKVVSIDTEILDRFETWTPCHFLKSSTYGFNQAVYMAMVSTGFKFQSTTAKHPEIVLNAVVYLVIHFGKSQEI